MTDTTGVIGNITPIIGCMAALLVTIRLVMRAYPLIRGEPIAKTFHKPDAAYRHGVSLVVGR